MCGHSEKFSAGSWTQQLYNILRPAPHPLATLFKNGPHASRCPPGSLWRNILSKNIKNDLAGPMNRPGTRRCFVQIESMGLNGLLFYEIQSPTSTPSTTKDSVLLTSGSVVGNRHDTHALEMDYLDTVNGKVVYFPAYACTSFLAGQVMHAHLHKISDLRPHPTRDGFTVLSLDDAEDPHFSDLFVRQATLPSSEDSPNRRSSLNDLYDAKEEGDSSLETVESLGIFTPPLGSSVDVTLGTNDVNRHRKPAVDPDLPSFLDLSYEDVDAGRAYQISNVGSGHKIYQPVRTVK